MIALTALVLAVSGLVCRGGEGDPASLAKVGPERAGQLKNLKWGMFICWSFSTFSGREWTPTKDKDASYFKATGCDTDQWAQTAKEAGMGYILFLAKHHDGFCLWDTKTTDKKVSKSSLGIDVLAKLRASCEKYGIKLAIYFSEGDWNWPGAVDGKGGANGGGSNAEVKKAQLKELLTQYGPVEYIWFDHAVGTGGLSHADTIAWCKSFQPGCFVGFNHGDQQGSDIRLGEMGRPGPLDDHNAAGPHMRDAAAKSYLLAEFTYPILPPHKGGAMWFYSLPEHDNLCHPAEKLYKDYLGAVKYGNIFSIDIGPNYEGKLRAIDVKTLRQVGEMIKNPPPADAPAPSPERVQEFKNLKWGMFICWSFSTFSGKEWTGGVKDVAFFKATGCDTDQWAQTAKEAGMGYILFLTKHHDGFCLWDTKTTERKVTQSPLRRDVLAELRKSCDKYGIKLALYFSEGDWSWPGAKDGQGGGTGSGVDIQRAQLKELCTQYGPIEFFWMDCAAGHPDGDTHQKLNNWVKSFQPGCFVGCNGGRPDDGTDLRAGEMGRPGKVNGFPVGEFTYPILPPHEGGAMWFYSLPKHDGLCYPAEKLYKDYLGAVKFGNIFSLDVGPNYEGKLREIDVKTLQQVGEMIKNPPALPTPRPSLALGKPARASSTWNAEYDASKAFDDDESSRWGAAADARSGWLEVDLGQETKIGGALIKELGFHRTQAFVVEYQDGETWKELAKGTTIAGEKTIEFAPVTARRIRLNILKANEVPTIEEFHVFAPVAK
jgi:alpha-L-fucosidase